jgi:hypothetical protein
MSVNRSIIRRSACECEPGQELADDAVQVRYHTPIITTATVTDDDGVAHWVCRTRHSGWECSCSDSGVCAHVLAVQVVAR